jgi:hypothetical protein
MERKTWHNTASGNELAGVRPPRLTRAKVTRERHLLRDTFGRRGIEAKIFLDVRNGPGLFKRGLFQEHLHRFGEILAAGFHVDFYLLRRSSKPKCGLQRTK